MLVLTRRPGEDIIADFGGAVMTLTIIEITGNKVRMAFKAPANVIVHRAEVAQRIAAGELKKEPAKLPA